MARNVEIKARLASIEAMLPRVAALRDSGPVEIRQDDTFFRCDAGRLKLRDFLDGSGELIFYRRSDRRGPKESFYLRSATWTPEAPRAWRSPAGNPGKPRKRNVAFRKSTT